jgi:uncharacterized membrane-anchored protein
MIERTERLGQAALEALTRSTGGAALDRIVEELAAASGFTLEELWQEISRIEWEHDGPLPPQFSRGPSPFSKGAGGIP